MRHRYVAHIYFDLNNTVDGGEEEVGEVGEAEELSQRRQASAGQCARMNSILPVRLTQW